jgi:TPP-dependent pyruvate/acetoin dehydrogenase alpha subunit
MSARPARATATAVQPFALSKEEACRALYDMQVIRIFEERVLKLVGEGAIKGTSHLYIGEEAVAVGVCLALRPDDMIVSTHRGHGHFIAKGGDLNRIMAELFGKLDGYCQGKGGTQHMADFAIGHLGSNGITGGGIPLATGAALSAQMRRSGQVVVSFFGDGAANQGVFHESLNLAALWRLPIVYVCENNLYSMSTPVHDAFPIHDIAQRAAAYDMPAAIGDGMDVAAVHTTALPAIERARAGGGPSLIEYKTYRYLGHSKSDMRVYRTKEEEAAWRQRDPIDRLRAQLKDVGVARDELEDIDARANSAVDAAVDFSRRSPFPSAAIALQGLFSN